MGVDFGEIYNTAWGVLGVVGGIGSVIAMLWVSHRSLRERNDEEDARAFYSEHGHWPDQEPGAAPDPLPPSAR